jgi:hypothetical protein
MELSEEGLGEEVYADTPGVVCARSKEQEGRRKRVGNTEGAVSATD